MQIRLHNANVHASAKSCNLMLRTIQRESHEHLAARRLLGEADHIGHWVGARAEDKYQGRRAHLRRKEG